MDADDEQQLLHILRAAQGDPAMLALVPLDITFSTSPTAERSRLRQALIAAAVPHWFDAHFLATLLATSLDEACDLMGKLRRLTNVETFPSRGESAYNVHKASRLALRQHLRIHQPDLWQTFAHRAHKHLASGKETHERIEALYHLFAANTRSAIKVCKTLNHDLVFNSNTHYAFSLALTELTKDGWLTGAALTVVERISKTYYSKQNESSQHEPSAKDSHLKCPDDFDVFLCHNSEDKTEVERIGLLLKKHGLRPWLDKWELQPGKAWMPMLETQIETIRAAAVFVGSSGIGPWQREEIQALLTEFQSLGRPVIPVLLPDVSAGPKLPLFLKGRTWVDFQKPESLPLDQLLWGITGTKTQELRNSHEPFT